jgi:hypothetical protein
VTNPTTGYKHLVTVNSKQPLSSFAPEANSLNPGPDISVAFQLDGLFTSPTKLQIGVTLTDNTLGNISTEVEFSDALLGPAQACEAVASVINTLGLECIASGQGQLVVIDIVAPVTAATITALTVT